MLLHVLLLEGQAAVSAAREASAVWSTPPPRPAAALPGAGPPGGPVPGDGALRPAEGTARPARPSRGCRERPGLLGSFPSQLGLYKNLEQERPCAPGRKGLNRCRGNTLCPLDLRMQKGRIPPITLKTRSGLGFGKGARRGPASSSPGPAAELRAPFWSCHELKFRQGGSQSREAPCSRKGHRPPRRLTLRWALT